MVELRNNSIDFDIDINLPGSKSIHNRILILNTLYDLKLSILNGSESDDTLLLTKLITREERELNCGNAGTVFRFLTAYLAVQPARKILTGSDRMLNRPIGDLTDVLMALGASIQYLGKEGFPPIQIEGRLKKGGILKVNGDKSSQFISALCMIGPSLITGLEIIILGEISSRPYFEMTIKLMQSLGFDVTMDKNHIITKPWDKKCEIQSIEIEPDWSAVVFWFQIIALSGNGKVFIHKLNKWSVQGDSILTEWAEMLGIKHTFTPQGLKLERSLTPSNVMKVWDFRNYPDLAPAIIVLLSALRQKATFKGLESLSIKESDRTLALQTELIKCNVTFYPSQKEWILDASAFELKEHTVFETYNDHRIAMALAPLVFIKPIKIRNPEVVNKSYPEFWKHLQLAHVTLIK